MRLSTNQAINQPPNPPIRLLCWCPPSVGVINNVAASTDGDGVDKELEVIAGTAADNLNTMDSLVSKLKAGGSLQEFVTALADGFLDIVEVGLWFGWRGRRLVALYT